MAIPSCCCGNHIKSLKDLPRSSPSLDSSFVHLEPVNPPLSILNQAETLLKVTEGNAIEEGIWLCVDCLERVARALEADTERLEHEWHAYDDAVKARQERLRGLEKTIASTLFSPNLDELQKGTLER